MRLILADVLEWMLQNPVWIFGIFPLLFGSVAWSMWREHRRQMKLEANPINMTNTEYKRYNNKRFQK